MKGVTIVKAVRISDTNYSKAKPAAKRWLESASIRIAQNAYNRTKSQDRHTRAWRWSLRYLVCEPNSMRSKVYAKRLARVERVMEKLLK